MNVRITLTTTEIKAAILQYLRANHELKIPSNLENIENLEFIDNKTNNIIQEPRVRIYFETDHYAKGPYR